MNLVDTLREIVEGLNWKFYYGRRDFQNLEESDQTKDVQFFLDPVRRTPGYSDSGLPTGAVSFEGYFMMLVSSDMDKDYDGASNNSRWLDHIKPMLEERFAELESKIICNEGLTINRMSSTDIINVFDENLDGILVSYQIQYTA